MPDKQFHDVITNLSNYGIRDSYVYLKEDTAGCALPIPNRTAKFVIYG